VVDLISALGAGSGIDIKKLAKNLSDATHASEQSQLNSKKKAAESRISSVGKIMSTVNDFTDALKSLGNSSTFQRIPTSSDTTKVKVNFIDGTIPPTFNSTVKVVKKAIEASVIMPKISSLEANLLSSGATGNFKLVNTDTGATLQEFDLSTYNTLPKLRDAINALTGYTASIIQGGTSTTPHYYLSIKRDSGAANSFQTQLSTSDSMQNFAGTVVAGDSPTTTAGQDAEIQIDGISITSATNDFKNILPGLQITAVDTTGATDALISSKTDTATLSNAISTVVVGFNALVKTIQSETAYSEDPTKRGALANNSSVKQLLNNLQKFTTQRISGYASTSHTMSEIGISTNKDGTISLNERTFAKVLRDSPLTVEAVLASKRQILDTRIKFGSAGASFPQGVYEISKTGSTTWSINGQDAQYANGILKFGNDNASSLSLVVSSELGDSGVTSFSTKLNYAKGMIERFSDMLTDVANTNSSIQKITAVATTEITKINTGQSNLNNKMTALNNRYVKQFATMQTFITQANDTKKSLTSMMDAWSNSMKG